MHKWKVQLCELNYDHAEREAVASIIENEWLTMGEHSKRFEQEFSSFINHHNQGVFVSSATAGLHLLLMAVGISHGDEVIIPALTFVSDANTVVQLGAKPVLADSSSLEDLNVSVESIKEKISSKTKAIVVVHFAGYPMDLSELIKICTDREILLIEDCAHAPGAKINDAFCGTLGDASFFSFFSNKNLAIGEGGMVFCKNEELNRRVNLMRSHGMSAVTLDRHEGRSFSYDVISHGLNYRPDEIRGALGIVQLSKLEVGNKKRQNLVKRYIECLDQTILKIPFLATPKHHVGAFHIMPVLLPKETQRKKIMERLKSDGIQTSIHYPNFKNFSVYQSMFEHIEIPMVDEICAREMTLPLHPRMSSEDVEYISSCVNEAINHG